MARPSKTQVAEAVAEVLGVEAQEVAELPKAEVKKFVASKKELDSLAKSVAHDFVVAHDESKKSERTFKERSLEVAGLLARRNYALDEKGLHQLHHYFLGRLAHDFMAERGERKQSEYTTRVVSDMRAICQAVSIANHNKVSTTYTIKVEGKDGKEHRKEVKWTGDSAKAVLDFFRDYKGNYRDMITRARAMKNSTPYASGQGNSGRERLIKTATVIAMVQKNAHRMRAETCLALASFAINELGKRVTKANRSAFTKACDEFIGTATRIITEENNKGAADRVQQAAQGKEAASKRGDFSPVARVKGKGKVRQGKATKVAAQLLANMQPASHGPLPAHVAVGAVQGRSAPHARRRAA